jgi:predicted nucleic acid-binding protein
MIHLDTNFLVSALASGSQEETKLSSWLSAGEPLGISAVAWAEFFSGPLSAREEQMVRQMFAQVEVLSGPDAEMAAQLFNKTGRRSRRLADCMIPATALRCGARLATMNTPDFQHFVSHGLVLA